jgi:hypothetical protein
VVEFQPAVFQPALFQPAEFQPAEFQPAEFQPAEFQPALPQVMGSDPVESIWLGKVPVLAVWVVVPVTAVYTSR